jgi:uncharacterized repeat protein (TIGR01451 family)
MIELTQFEFCGGVSWPGRNKKEVGNLPTKVKITLLRCSSLAISLFILLSSSVVYSVENTGSPILTKNDRQVITHMGKIASKASPGDSIEYITDYTNKGTAAAKNVSIVFVIPKGTTYMPRSVSVKKGPVPSKILFMDKSKNAWVEKYSVVENIASVKCIVDTVVPTTKGPSGIISIKVIVNL